MSRVERCDRCKWAGAVRPQVHGGLVEELLLLECRNSPPKLFGKRPNQGFPRVAPDDFCSEFAEFNGDHQKYIARARALIAERKEWEERMKEAERTGDWSGVK